MPCCSCNQIDEEVAANRIVRKKNRLVCLVQTVFETSCQLGSSAARAAVCPRGELVQRTIEDPICSRCRVLNWSIWVASLHNFFPADNTLHVSWWIWLFRLTQTQPRTSSFTQQYKAKDYVKQRSWYRYVGENLENDKTERANLHVGERGLQIILCWCLRLYVSRPISLHGRMVIYQLCMSLGLLDRWETVLGRNSWDNTQIRVSPLGLTPIL